MDQQNFEKIKKDFIVDEEEYSKDKLSSLMSKLSSFCKITKDGQVILMKKVSTRKMLKLILSARFIANAVNKSILPEVGKDELKAYSSMKNDVFNTRFNEILRENFAEKKNDKLKSKNILLVEQFLENLK